MEITESAEGAKTKTETEGSGFGAAICCELFDSGWMQSDDYEWRKRINPHGVPLTSIRYPGWLITWACDCDPQEIFNSQLSGGAERSPDQRPVRNYDSFS